MYDRREEVTGAEGGKALEGGNVAKGASGWMAWQSGSSGMTADMQAEGQLWRAVAVRAGSTDLMLETGNQRRDSKRG